MSQNYEEVSRSEGYVYCPSCKYFGQCTPDPEEYNLPCDSFEEQPLEDDSCWVPLD